MLYVVSVGPGAKEYILPAAFEVVAKCGAVAGGKRNLEAFALDGKKVFTIGIQLDALRSFIDENDDTAVLASGDAGFYGILAYLRRFYTEVTVVPGISSVQYLFAKLALPWNHAILTSLHGQDARIEALVRKNRHTAVLTDGNHTPAVLAKRLKAAGLSHVRMWVGENLSYPEERIVQGTVEEIEKQSFGMCVVVIENERQ